MFITSLSSDQWQIYRELRLQALKSDEKAFCSSYEEELTFTEQQWRQRICNMTFALIENHAVALIGLLPAQNLENEASGMVVSLWVKPDFRGSGLARALIRAVQDKAKMFGYKTLFLHVTTTQTAAIKLYEEMGFQHKTLLQKSLFKKGRFFDAYLMEWKVKLAL